MIISARIKTKAKKEKIEKIGENSYKVSVRAAPKDNKANLAVIKLIKKEFGQKARIIKGKKTKNKLIELL